MNYISKILSKIIECNGKVFHCKEKNFNSLRVLKSLSYVYVRSKLEYANIIYPCLIRHHFYLEKVLNYYSMLHSFGFKRVEYIQICNCNSQLSFKINSQFD